MLINTDVLQFNSFYNNLQLITEAAMDKIRTLQKNGVTDPFWFHFILKYENLINWQEVYTSEDFHKQVKKLVKELLLRTKRDHPNSFYMKDIDLKEEFAAHQDDPQVQQAWAIFQSDPEAAKRKILNVVNSAKEKVFKKWIEYVTKDNDVYAPNYEFQYTLLKPIFEISNEGQKATPPGANAEAIAGVYKKIEDTKGVVQFGITKFYKEAATAAITGGSVGANIPDGWFHIPGETSDSKHFDDNVEKLQTLSSGTGWCTASGLAEPYLKKGDFWIYIKGGKAVVAIRLLGTDDVAEIRGKHNESPVEYLPQIRELANKQDFYGANQWIQNSERTSKMIEQFKRDSAFRKDLIRKFITKRGVSPIDPAKEFTLRNIPEDVLRATSNDMTNDFSQLLPVPGENDREIVRFVLPYLTENTEIRRAYTDFLLNLIKTSLLSDHSYIWSRWTHLADPYLFHDNYFLQELTDILQEATTVILSDIKKRSNSIGNFVSLLRSTTQIDTSVMRRKIYDAMIDNGLNMGSLSEDDIAEAEAQPQLKEKLIAHNISQKPLEILQGFRYGGGRKFGAQTISDPAFIQKAKQGVLEFPLTARWTLEALPSIAQDPEVVSHVKQAYRHGLMDIIAKGKKSSVELNDYYIPYVRSEPEIQQLMIECIKKFIIDRPFVNWKYLLDDIKAYNLPITQDQVSRLFYDALISRIANLQTGDSVRTLISDVAPSSVTYKAVLPISNFVKTLEVKTILKNKIIELLKQGQLVEIGTVRRILTERDFSTVEYKQLISNVSADPDQFTAAKEKAKEVLNQYVFARKKRIMLNIISKPNPTEAFLAAIRRHYGLPVSILRQDAQFMKWVNTVITSHQNHKKAVLTESFANFFSSHQY